jgi:hypothetical protein
MILHERGCGENVTVSWEILDQVLPLHSLSLNRGLFIDTIESYEEP